MMRRPRPDEGDWLLIVVSLGLLLLAFFRS